jgi:hypothetical protein
MNDHQTSAYDAAGHATGSAPPSLAAGDGSTTHLADPSTRHRCITTSRLSPKRVGSRSAIPDGTVDIHHPDGTAIHLEADGSTWQSIR